MKSCLKLFIFILTFWLAIVNTCFALIGGKADNSQLYSAVVLLIPTRGYVCSATKIGPYRFLTAADCVVEPRSAMLQLTMKAGGQIAVSNTSVPRNASDFSQLEVQETLLNAYSELLA